MLLLTDETIAAIASPPGGALRGILRISGPRTVECLQQCFQSSDGRRLSSVRGARVLSGQLRLTDPRCDLPCELYLWPDDRSYTRQPVAEIHALGAAPLLEAALDAVCSAGARPARPGEFTLRAFLAGRLDLTQAEAVLGVIDAESRRELDVALQQLAGGLATPLNRLRDDLLDLLAHLEAGLDFVDEDIQFITRDQLQHQLRQAAEQVHSLLAQMDQRQVSRHEVRIVLRGWPNVGKSSLLNALAGQQAALVSEMAGTTRDFVSCRLQIDGVDCLLVDTAGVEPDATEPLVAESQVIGSQQRQQATLELLCLDASRPLNAWERRELAEGDHPARLLVYTKSDLADLAAASANGPPAVWTSSTLGLGLDELRGVMGERLKATSEASCQVVGTTAGRCRGSLREARRALRRARRAATAGLGDELVAMELRLALDELGEVVGAVYTDDVLDRIFSRFCIGK